MARKYYDPEKAHAYYERTKKLKGRKKGSKTTSPPKHHSTGRQGAQERVVRLKGYVSKLKEALSETEAELSKQRQSAHKTAKANSDGKSTASQKQASQKYKDAHQQEIKNKAKQASSSSGGSRRSGSSSSKASSQNVSDMNAQALRARASQLRSMLRDARQQLASATQELGHLAHSEMLADPQLNEHFARFQSAERIPSR